MTLPDLFRQRLAAAMARRGVTQTALAEAAQTTQSNVSRVLSGEQATVSIDYAERLARAVGVELWRLLKP
jgi:transcriptional regulator with XRE-family HTH domain